MPIVRRKIRTEDTFSGGIRVRRVFKDGWVQTLPYVPSEYYSRVSESNPVGTGPARNAISTHAFGRVITAQESAMLRAQQAAYAKFRSKSYDTAELALLFFERKEAASMINKRGLQFARAFMALRKGKFRTFLRLLGISPRHRHRHTKWIRPQQAASLWLEYWFGWSPLISDIYSAVDVLQSPYPNREVTARSRRRTHLTIVTSGSNATDVTLDGFATYGYYAKVELDNPLLFRANQLGVINPATIVWEMIPFSFIVDWFIPVGDFLSAPATPAGVVLRDPSRTLKYEMWGSEKLWNSTTGYVFNSSRTHVVDFRRYLGHEQPKLPRFDFDTLSLSRAASAISLIIAIFGGKGSVRI